MLKKKYLINKTGICDDILNLVIGGNFNETKEG